MEKYFYTKNLSIGYDKKSLIDNINIGIYKGQILTLIGPNGSGKSTFIKSIIKELPPVNGIVYLDGKDIKDYTGKEYAKKLAVILTERIKTEMMSAYDVVALGRYPYTDYFGRLTKEDDAIVKDALEKVNATGFANQDFLSLSDGQKQRVMFGRAIAQQPDIIILDEPTSFLDIKHKIELLNILQEMVINTGLTVIMSLHEIDFAGKVSDYIMTVDGEHKVEFGTPEEMFTKDKIRKLYNLTEGAYDVNTGSVELNRTCGKPKVLVLGGAGKGIPFYRELSRKRIPFAAGIIYENDIDYPVANALASELVTQKPFCTIDDILLEKMYRLADSVDYVIDAGCPVGETNGKINQIKDYCKSNFKLENHLRLA